jgi:hypothetical protein
MDTQSSAEGVQTQTPPPAPQSFIPLGNTTPTGPEGWSWGAFMLGPFFLIAVRKYVYLWAYLLMLVPVVNFVAWLGIMVFLGVKGRAMGYESTTFTSNEQREGFFKAIDHGGKIMFIISVIGLVVWFVFVALFFGALFSAF